MRQLVLVRHGESEWNRLNLFTGWTDVDLSEKGWDEARAAGRLMRSEGLAFDVCYTSYLKRAIHTANAALGEMDMEWIPVKRSWRLNERHYGALQGLNKSETAEKYGEEQVRLWRRSYDVRPPALQPGDERDPSREPRYASEPPEGRPLTESLEDTVARVVPYYRNVVCGDLKEGKRVVVFAHGNSLRALVKHLDGLSSDEVVGLNIPTGAPILYELDENLDVVSKRYLGDAKDIEARQKAVAAQGSAKRARYPLTVRAGLLHKADPMPSNKTTVDPGVCKLKTVIVAKPTDDMMGVTFEVESECPHVREWAAKVKEVSPYELMGQSMIDTPIYQATKGVLPHAACPCPCAMVKAMEVAADLGLKRDVNISIADLDE